MFTRRPDSLAAGLVPGLNATQSATGLELTKSVPLLFEGFRVRPAFEPAN